MDSLGGRMEDEVENSGTLIFHPVMLQNALLVLALGLTVNNASSLASGKNRFSHAFSQQMAAFSIKWLGSSHFSLEVATCVMWFVCYRIKYRINYRHLRGITQP